MKMFMKKYENLDNFSLKKKQTKKTERKKPRNDSNYPAITLHSCNYT